MIAYHCDSNTILQAPFVNRKDKHRIRAYNSIMKKLTDRGHHVDIQILNNEVSAEFKKTIQKDWGAKYQLVPPNVHRRNIAERILQAPFVNRKDKHRIRAYNTIMKKLTDRGHQVDIQILDNEVSADFKKTIQQYWGAKYQLVPPNFHR